MKYKIGVYGSAAGDIEAALPKAKELGKTLAGYSDRLILITGACPGLPYAVIEEAALSGIEIWGFSSSRDLEGQRREYPADPTDIYTRIIYVSKDFPYADDPRICKKYRNISSTAVCDAAVFISGRWGTLNEFTDVIDFRKPAAVLTGTGGIADELPSLSAKVHKEGQGPVVFDSDPHKLIRKLLQELDRR
jgi:predicted Rossmann-fold nucleotide-binding protein